MNLFHLLALFCTTLELVNTSLVDFSFFYQYSTLSPIVPTLTAKVYVDVTSSGTTGFHYKFDIAQPDNNPWIYVNGRSCINSCSVNIKVGQFVQMAGVVDLSNRNTIDTANTITFLHMGSSVILNYNNCTGPLRNCEKDTSIDKYTICACPYFEEQCLLPQKSGSCLPETPPDFLFCQSLQPMETALESNSKKTSMALSQPGISDLGQYTIYYYGPSFGWLRILFTVENYYQSYVRIIFYSSETVGDSIPVLYVNRVPCYPNCCYYVNLGEVLTLNTYEFGEVPLQVHQKDFTTSGLVVRYGSCMHSLTECGYSIVFPGTNAEYVICACPGWGTVCSAGGSSFDQCTIGTTPSTTSPVVTACTRLHSQTAKQIQQVQQESDVSASYTIFYNKVTNFALTYSARLYMEISKVDDSTFYYNFYIAQLRPDSQLIVNVNGTLCDPSCCIIVMVGEELNVTTEFSVNDPLKFHQFNNSADGVSLIYGKCEMHLESCQYSETGSADNSFSVCACPGYSDNYLICPTDGTNWDACLDAPPTFPTLLTCPAKTPPRVDRQNDGELFAHLSVYYKKFYGGGLEYGAKVDLQVDQQVDQTLQYNFVITQYDDNLPLQVYVNGTVCNPLGYASCCVVLASGQSLILTSDFGESDPLVFYQTSTRADGYIVLYDGCIQPLEQCQHGQSGTTGDTFSLCACPENVIPGEEVRECSAPENEFDHCIGTTVVPASPAPCILPSAQPGFDEAPTRFTVFFDDYYAAEGTHPSGARVDLQIDQLDASTFYYHFTITQTGPENLTVLIQSQDTQGIQQVCGEECCSIVRSFNELKLSTSYSLQSPILFFQDADRAVISYEGCEQQFETCKYGSAYSAGYNVSTCICAGMDSQCMPRATFDECWAPSTCVSPTDFVFGPTEHVDQEARFTVIYNVTTNGILTYGPHIDLYVDTDDNLNFKYHFHIMDPTDLIILVNQLPCNPGCCWYNRVDHVVNMTTRYSDEPLQFLQGGPNAEDVAVVYVGCKQKLTSDQCKNAIYVQDKLYYTVCACAGYSAECHDATSLDVCWEPSKCVSPTDFVFGPTEKVDQQARFTVIYNATIKGKLPYVPHIDLYVDTDDNLNFQYHFHAMDKTDLIFLVNGQPCDPGCCWYNRIDHAVNVSTAIDIAGQLYFDTQPLKFLQKGPSPEDVVIVYAGCEQKLAADQCKQAITIQDEDEYTVCACSGYAANCRNPTPFETCSQIECPAPGTPGINNVYDISSFLVTFDTSTSDAFVNMHVTTIDFVTFYYQFDITNVEDGNLVITVGGARCLESCCLVVLDGEGITVTNVYAIEQSVTFKRNIWNTEVIYDNCLQTIENNCLNSYAEDKSTYSAICVCQGTDLKGCSGDDQMITSCYQSTRIAPILTTKTTHRPALTTQLQSTMVASTSVAPSTAQITTMRTTAAETTKAPTTLEPSTVQSTPHYTTPKINNYPSLQNLSDTVVTLDNVSHVLNLTLAYSEEGPSLNSDDVYYISNILNNSANLQGLPQQDAMNIMENIDNVLNANSSAISDSESSERFISLLPIMVSNMAADVLQFLNGSNIGFTSNKVISDASNINGLRDTGSVFQSLSGQAPKSQLNTIYIPPESIQGTACEYCVQTTHVLFSIYRNRKFFSSKKQYRPYSTFAANADDDDHPQPAPPLCDRQNQLPEHSPILSASLLSNSTMVSRLSGVNVMAKLQFNVTELLRPLHGSYKVTWWDEDADLWATSDQCTSNLKDGVVYAECPHLTDFTLIIDSAPNDPTICEQGLIDVGLATNTISMTALLFLMVIQISAYLPLLSTITIFRRLRGEPLQARDSVQLLYNIILFLFYFVFSIFSDQKVSGKACSFVAALSYSLLLCSLLLTIFQALRTVMKFFPNVIQNIIMIILRPLVALTICFLIPFVLSLTLGFFTHFFRREDGFCWVRPDLILYAIIIPVSILIINAIVCTTLVSWRIFGANRKFSRMGRQHDGQLGAKLVAIVIMQITMGMSWILQYLTLYHTTSTVWHYIFTIVMGSQGTVLTLLYFYKRRKIQMSSRRMNKRKNVPEGPVSYDLQGFFSSMMTSFILHATRRAMKRYQDEENRYSEETQEEYITDSQDSPYTRESYTDSYYN